MISSRWPRPIAVIESIALSPVYIGSFTGCRWMTPGALNSSGRRSVASIGPSPSSGLPSGSTTRPSSPRPTGTLMTSPVRRTGSPSLDALPLAEERNADVVLLEVEGDARHAVLELEPLERDAVLEAVDASDAVAHLEDAADLGEVGLDVELLDSILEDRGDLFGSELQRVSLVSRSEFVAQALEAAANASVGAVRADLQDDAADEVRVDRASGLDRSARGLLDRLHDRLRLVVGELVRRRELHGKTVLRLRDEGVELRC